MEELIAKRYVKALKSSLGSLDGASAIFFALAQEFDNDKFVRVINNPNVSKKDKSDILLSAINGSDLDGIKNFIRLLVENNRVSIIPSIAEVMRKDIAQTTKSYSGVIYSDSEVNESVIRDLSAGLGRKFNSNISLKFVKENFDGVKVDVEDLGVEISFSKTRINNQMIEHIIKAI